MRMTARRGVTASTPGEDSYLLVRRRSWCCSVLRVAKRKSVGEVQLIRTGNYRPWTSARDPECEHPALPCPSLLLVHSLHLGFPSHQVSYLHQQPYGEWSVQVTQSVSGPREKGQRSAQRYQSGRTEPSQPLCCTITLLCTEKSDRLK